MFLLFIVIGGYENTRSYIAKCRDCDQLVSAPGQRLQCNRINEYWIHFEDRHIRVGLTGQRVPFLDYEVPEDDFNPRYLGYSTSVLSQGMFTFSFDKLGCEYAYVLYY